MSKAPNTIRYVNKRVFNPLMIQLAGRRFWYVAVIHHSGRRSGKIHSTPVTALRVPRGFVIGLPYGTAVDWLRNLEAADGATLQLRGRIHKVVAPEILEAQAVLPQLSSKARWFMARLGMPQFVRVDEVSG